MIKGSISSEKLKFNGIKKCCKRVIADINRIIKADKYFCYASVKKQKMSKLILQISQQKKFLMISASPIYFSLLFSYFQF